MVAKEKRLFETQGLKDGIDFFLVDVPYLLDERYYYLHTFIGKTPSRKDPQNIVLIHGYGGSLA